MATPYHALNIESGQAGPIPGRQPERAPERKSSLWSAARLEARGGVDGSRLLSVNVGLPREITWRGQTVRTAIWKEPVQGKRLVRRLNIDGDAQGDLAAHGGEHRAVFVYQFDSYRYWQDQLHRTGFTFGQFGENFTVEGLPDTEVCIGDRYQIGGALFEVTQPRVTCYRVGIRMDEPRMAALLVSHGRPGFYFRVLQEGEVQAGDEIVKVLDGPEGMSVAEINAAVVPARPSASKAGAGASHPCAQRRLAGVFPGAPAAGVERRDGDRQPWPDLGRWPASSLARVSSFARLRELYGRARTCFLWNSSRQMIVRWQLPCPGSSLSCACARSPRGHRSCAVTRSRARQAPDVIAWASNKNPGVSPAITWPPGSGLATFSM